MSSDVVGLNVGVEAESCNFPTEEIDTDAHHTIFQFSPYIPPKWCISRQKLCIFERKFFSKKIPRQAKVVDEARVPCVPWHEATDNEYY